MRDDSQPTTDRPINRRNTLIALGAVGAIILFSNLGVPDMDFGWDDHDKKMIVIDDARTEKSAASAGTIDEKEVEAAVEALVAGNIDRFIKMMEKL